MILSETIFNLNAIQKRVQGLDRVKLHYFSKGAYSQLDAAQIRGIKDVIEIDYKNAMSILDEALSKNESSTLF